MTKEERKTMIKDTLDGKFDASIMIDNTEGLLPIPLSFINHNWN